MRTKDKHTRGPSLIAAAPDMLQSLREVIESVKNLGLQECYGQTFGSTYTQDKDCPCTLCKCRAAIRKAEGGAK